MEEPSRAPQAIVIAPGDNVAVVLRDFAAGEPLEVEGRMVVCSSRVPSGHKVALEEITASASILKCGVAVGVARRNIAAGEHVHVHNVASRYITDH